MAGNTKAKTKVFWVCVIARPWRAAVWFGPGTLAVLIYIFLFPPVLPFSGICDYSTKIL